LRFRFVLIPLFQFTGNGKINEEKEGNVKCDKGRDGWVKGWDGWAKLKQEMKGKCLTFSSTASWQQIEFWWGGKRRDVPSFFLTPIKD
jgi:hypothetical protein